MANNRMLLVHVPTGLFICLGKRLTFGWYVPPNMDIADNLEKLFNAVDNGSPKEQDNFVLAMEDTEYAPGVLADWSYSGQQEKGLNKLVLHDAQSSKD